MFEQKRSAADKLSADIAEARRKKLEADALKTSRLRDLRLAKEAADAQAAREAKTGKAKGKRRSVR